MNPSPAPEATKVGPPMWLLCEVTYRCPLHCAFCSNPVDFAAHDAELDTDQWLKVLREARALGAVQLGLSGGEPLARDDLEILVGEAHRLGYYVNLISSGIGLTEQRIEALHKAGLDHIQISFQDSSRELNDFLSSTRTFELKSRVAALIKEHHYPMVLNVVLHRLNIDHVEAILDMAERMNADYVELANTQYYGWAWHNRAQLMPTREQVQRAEAAVARFRARNTTMRVFFVVPDYFERRPKPCMQGLGKLFMAITPDGTALPCHAARQIKDMQFPNVRDNSMHDIWYQSAAFNRFRGYGWMKEPCKSCPEKERDFGGCRCQAYQMTGDATNTDPVCELSPDRHLVDEAVAQAATAASTQNERPLVFRSPKNSARLTQA